MWIDEWLSRMRGLPGAARYIGLVLAGGVILGVAGAGAWRLVRRPPAGPA